MTYPSGGEGLSAGNVCSRRASLRGDCGVPVSAFARLRALRRGARWPRWEVRTRGPDASPGPRPPQCPSCWESFSSSPERWSHSMAAKLRVLKAAWASITEGRRVRHTKTRPNHAPSTAVWKTAKVPS